MPLPRAKFMLLGGSYVRAGDIGKVGELGGPGFRLHVYVQHRAVKDSTFPVACVLYTRTPWSMCRQQLQSK